MNRISVVVIMLSFLVISCSNSQNNPSDKKPNIKVNPIKKETATKANVKSTTSEASAEDSKSEGASPAQLAKAASLLEEVDQPEVDKIDSKKLFKIHCSICHGFKGDMMINGAKDLVKSRISINEAIAQVYHGKGLMTPYKGVLTDAEIIAVSQYTETLRK